MNVNLFLKKKLKIGNGKEVRDKKRRVLNSSFMVRWFKFKVIMR